MRTSTFFFLMVWGQQCLEKSTNKSSSLLRFIYLFFFCIFKTHNAIHNAQESSNLSRFLYFLFLSFVFLKLIMLYISVETSNRQLNWHLGGGEKRTYIRTYLGKWNEILAYYYEYIIMTIFVDKISWYWFKTSNVIFFYHHHYI